MADTKSFALLPIGELQAERHAGHAQRARFAAMAQTCAHWAGKPVTFLVCVALVLAWAISGPFFGYSDTWQLIINTSTTIVTLLMVFLIQNTQNRDTMAMQVKLAELIFAVTGAEDRLRPPKTYPSRSSRKFTSASARSPTKR